MHWSKSNYWQKSTAVYQLTCFCTRNMMSVPSKWSTLRPLTISGKSFNESKTARHPDEYHTTAKIWPHWNTTIDLKMASLNCCACHPWNMVRVAASMRFGFTANRTMPCWCAACWRTSAEYIPEANKVRTATKKYCCAILLGRPTQTMNCC